MAVILTVGVLAIQRRWGAVMLGTNMVMAALRFTYPRHRFRCPHCRRRGAIGKRCSGCGIAVGTPKSFIDEAQKRWRVEHARDANDTVDPLAAVEDERLGHALRP
jgi:hypothetical protein